MWLKKAICKEDCEFLEFRFFKDESYYIVPSYTNNKEFIILRRSQASLGGIASINLAYDDFNKYFYNIQELRKMKLKKLNIIKN